VDYVAERSGARVVVATLAFPCSNTQQIIAAVLNCVSPRTRLALLDHVTSPTALILPIANLVSELNARGIDTLVDGAHAPCMVPLALSDLGAAYYTGNAHKWLCAPKGAAFLHVRRDRQAPLHPNAISHGYTAGFHAEFDWTGTFDPTPWLCIPEAIRFMDSVLPGGWPQVMAANRSLTLQARNVLLDSIGAAVPTPEAMIGSMASIPLPPAAVGSPAYRLDYKGLHDWFRERGVETWLYPNPVPLLRISAQLYNELEQFRQLASLVVGIGIFRTPALVATAAGGTSLFFAAWIAGGLISPRREARRACAESAVDSQNCHDHRSRSSRAAARAARKRGCTRRCGAFRIAPGGGADPLLLRLWWLSTDHKPWRGLAERPAALSLGHNGRHVHRGRPVPAA
jgi:isopenicillin-N epimerase